MSARAHKMRVSSRLRMPLTALADLDGEPGLAGPGDRRQRVRRPPPTSISNPTARVNYRALEGRWQDEKFLLGGVADVHA
jgi:hypothetical protein